MDRLIDREQWFYRTLHRTGVQKIKFGTECDSHWGGKNNRKLNPFIKTMVHRSNIHYSKINQKGNWKKYMRFPLELQKKWDLPRQLIQLCIRKGGLGILDIDTRLNSMSKTKWIQRLLSPTNVFWKDLMYSLKVILKSDQGLVLRQTQILRSTR